MLTKTLFGLAADLLRAVNVAILAMAEPIMMMMKSEFGTKWVSDFTFLRRKMMILTTHLEEKLTKAMTWQKKGRQVPRATSPKYD